MDNLVEIDKESYPYGTVVRSATSQDLNHSLRNIDQGIFNRAEVSIYARVGQPVVIFGGDSAKRHFLLQTLVSEQTLPKALVLESNEDFINQLDKSEQNTEVREVLYNTTYGKVTKMYNELVGKEIWNEETQELMNYIEAHELWDFEGEIIRNINQVGLSPEVLAKEFSKLSDGERKKILSVIMFMTNSQVIALNEPFQYLDALTRDYILSKIIEDKQRAYIIATAEEEVINNLEEGTLVGIDELGTIFVTETKNNFGYQRWLDISSAVISGWSNDAITLKTKINQLTTTVKAQRADQKRLRSKAAMQVTIQLENRLEALGSQYKIHPGYQYVEENRRESIINFETKKPIHGRIFKIEGNLSISVDDLIIPLPIINLDLKGSEFLLITGPNGSGKSSFVKALFKLYPEYKLEADLVEVRDNVLDIGYFNAQYVSSQLEKSHDKTLDAYLGKELGEKYSISRVNNYLAYWGIPYYTFRDRKCGLIKEEIPLFAQKLQLALLMCMSPNVLILDEPTGVGLSEVEIEKLISSIENYNGALIIISHDKRFIEDNRLNPDYHLDLSRQNLFKL